MARKPKKQNEVTLWTKAKWKAFVNAALTSQEKQEIKKLSLKPDELLQFFQDAATAGYKVSLSYSIPEDVYTLSLTGVYQQKSNAGLTISQRHRDFETLVTALHWMVGQDGYAIDWEERFGEVNTDDW